jgi:hypothetical protein
MSFKVVPLPGKPALTAKQVAHAKRILARWKVTSADSVTYNPTCGWIWTVNPKIELEFQELSFTDDGERVHNIKQIDDFSFKLKKWPPPHKREPAETKARPQNTSLKSKLRQRHR